MDYEARLCSVVDHVLARHRDALADVGLRADFRGVIENEESPGMSEARISVYEDNNWVDSLEFFVRRDSKPVTNAAEVESWLTEQLERLIADHPWGGGWERV